MSKTLNIFNKIDSLRQRYYKALVGKKELLELINENEVSEHVYNSNAIENSTVTLKEAEKILLKQELNRYLSERELFETLNLAKVVSLINIKAKEQELTLEVILSLHKTLLSNIRNDIAGRFRNNDEWVRVANHIAPNPKFVVGKLEEMLVQYNSTCSKNIIKRIALLHLTFEYIHPFVDGNGRIGRVLNNYLLIRDGFVPIDIKFLDQALYYSAFMEFEKDQSTSTMEEIVGKAISTSYHKRLAYLEGKDIVKLVDYAKENNLSHSNLINKANRQTIEAFLEKGVWKIGIPTTD